MSESTSAPAAPAAAPTPDSAPSSPPPNTQSPLSVSEAGRLLNQARRQASEAEGRPTPPPAATPPQRRPSANEAAAEAARTAAQPPAAPAAPKTEPAGLTALERALGLPGEGDAPPAPATPPAEAQALEIDGKRFTQAQLREALSKAGDYTQKTQELAQQRQALAAQQEALATVLPYIQPELARLSELVQGVGMPDAALLESDPQSYLKQWAQFQQASQEQARLGNLTQLQQQAQQRAMEQAVQASNAKLAEEFPFWADPAERAAAQQQIVQWAISEKGGFTRDELRGLASAHHLKTMMKAMAFDRMSERTRTQAPAPALQAPVRGAAPPPALTARVQQASEAFDARPSVKTGAALLAARRAR